MEILCCFLVVERLPVFIYAVGEAVVLGYFPVFWSAGSSVQKLGCDIPDIEIETGLSGLVYHPY